MEPNDDVEPNMVIAGYARLFAELLEVDVYAQLLEGVGEPLDDQWAALFVYDRDEDGYKKWTLFTADYRYAEMLARSGGKVAVPVPIIRERFPAFQKGWVIDDET